MLEDGLGTTRNGRYWVTACTLMISMKWRPSVQLISTAYSIFIPCLLSHANVPPLADLIATWLKLETSVSFMARQKTFCSSLQCK